RGAELEPAARGRAGARDVPGTAARAAARSDLVQRAVRARLVRDAARRRPAVRPLAAGREPAGARGRVDGASAAAARTFVDRCTLAARNPSTGAKHAADSARRRARARGARLAREPAHVLVRRLL